MAGFVAESWSAPRFSGTVSQRTLHGCATWFSGKFYGTQQLAEGGGVNAEIRGEVFLWYELQNMRTAGKQCFEFFFGGIDHQFDLSFERAGTHLAQRPIHDFGYAWVLQA